LDIVLKAIIAAVLLGILVVLAIILALLNDFLRLYYDPDGPLQVRVSGIVGIENADMYNSFRVSQRSV
jgi:hypothetical protein